ncbi:MAG: 2-iminoacetate synthase ThiH [Deferrisomatales bacterium]
MTFERFLDGQPLAEYARLAQGATDADVERALAAPHLGFEGYLALLSPAARPHLERVAQRAAAITRERFGRVVQMYAPLYVSNECTNACVYCGFHRGNPIARTTLSLAEVEAEAEAIWSQGFRSLLLVSGEAPGVVPPAYFERVAGRLRSRFASLSVEIYPLDEDGYRRLAAAGIDGLTLYQETYDRELYARAHPGGRKADYGWRLEGPSRGAAAGLRRVGIGALLGLGPWRREAAALGLHALWLQKTYWQTQVCVSFPRLRQAAGGFRPPAPVSDVELVQLACALRLLLPDAGLVLSTREPPALRDGLSGICITQMSAGSRTEPGGYTHPGDAGEQFAVEDRRTPAEVARHLLAAGLEPVWKDWDAAFTEGPGALERGEGARPCA